MKDLEFEKMNGLLPAIVQNADTREVLMLGYMNQESLEKTLNEKKVCFWSRSKKRLWTKGETSGNFLELVSIDEDCDLDALLIKVRPKGPTCHKGSKSCFGDKNENFTLLDLFSLLESRKKSSAENSYTKFLLEEGSGKISEKIIEESNEVVNAVENETKQRLIEESCDLIYHLFVLLIQQEISFQDLLIELKKRNQ